MIRPRAADSGRFVFESVFFWHANAKQNRHSESVGPQTEYLKEFGDIYKRLEKRLEPLLVNQEQLKRDKSYL